MTEPPRLASDPIAEAVRHWDERGWRDASGGMAAITSLMRAQQIALAQVEGVLRPYGVTFARYEVLMLLHLSRRGTLPMNTIGSRLQVHQTSVTNAVDRLEDAKLVRRLRHPSDRRTTLVELTSTGRRLAERATEALNESVFNDPGLPKRSITALIQILTQYRQQAGDF